MVWARAREHQERKTQAILEQLKKDQTRKGLKEMVVNEFIENSELEYSGSDTIWEIMTKIKEFVNKYKGWKIVKWVNEFKQLKQKDEESIRNLSLDSAQ